jgi:ribonuclease R
MPRCAARGRRAQPLDLDLPERRIVLTRTGAVSSVAFKDRLDAHRLIEEFMVLANVAAAENAGSPNARRCFTGSMRNRSPRRSRRCARRRRPPASRWPRGRCCKTASSTGCCQAAGAPSDELINMSVLRSMTQAYYSPENFGHFGLALRLRAFHLADPALFRPDRAPRADRGAWLGR